MMRRERGIKLKRKMQTNAVAGVKAEEVGDKM
jgi:hypothetical protein